jgi:hypothetical protein
MDLEGHTLTCMALQTHSGLFSDLANIYPDFQDHAWSHPPAVSTFSAIFVLKI